MADMEELVRKRLSSTEALTEAIESLGESLAERMARETGREPEFWMEVFRTFERMLEDAADRLESKAMALARRRADGIDEPGQPREAIDALRDVLSSTRELLQVVDDATRETYGFDDTSKTRGFDDELPHTFEELVSLAETVVPRLREADETYTLVAGSTVETTALADEIDDVCREYEAVFDHVPSDDPERWRLVAERKRVMERWRDIYRGVGTMFAGVVTIGDELERVRSILPEDDWRRKYRRQRERESEREKPDRSVEGRIRNQLFTTESVQSATELLTEQGAERLAETSGREAEFWSKMLQSSGDLLRDAGDRLRTATEHFAYARAVSMDEVEEMIEASQVLVDQMELLESILVGEGDDETEVEPRANLAPEVDDGLEFDVSRIVRVVEESDETPSGETVTPTGSKLDEVVQDELERLEASREVALSDRGPSQVSLYRERNDARDDWQHLYLGIGRIFEGAFRCIGEHDLADRIRPISERIYGGLVVVDFDVTELSSSSDDDRPESPESE